MHAWIEERPKRRTPGYSLIAVYMVGTPGKSVGLWRLMVSSTSPVAKVGSSTIAADKLMLTFIQAVIP